MLLAPADLNFMLNGLKTGYANCAIRIYGNASPPAKAADALPGTILGLVTLNGGAFTPGEPTNGLNFAAPAMGEMSKPVDAVWKFKGIASGIATYGVFIRNAGDPGALETGETYPRMVAKVGNVKGTLILSNSEIVPGAEITVDALTISFPAQSLI